MPIPISPPTITAAVARADTMADVGPRLPKEVRDFREVDEMLAATDVEPGIVLVGPHVPWPETVQLADRLDAREGRWIVVALEKPSTVGDFIGRPLSPGVRQDLAEVVAAAGPGADGVLMELGTVLHHVARARHDINNPLTTILAETQLLLLDTEEGALRESLETIERQARRIRDLVARLSVLRPPPV
jgi:signal transduction histidine kinase